MIETEVDSEQFIREIARAPAWMLDWGPKNAKLMTRHDGEEITYVSPPFSSMTVLHERIFTKDVQRAINDPQIAANRVGSFKGEKWQNHD